MDGFSTPLRIEKWKRTVRVVVFRKKISGKPAKDYQLKLFQPDDGFYEYSMVVTNKEVLGAQRLAIHGGSRGA